MASKKFGKGSPEWNMFQDYWKLCQEFWIPEDTDEYWEQFIDSGNNFLEKNNGKENGTFPNELFWALHKILEREYKEMKK